VKSFSKSDSHKKLHMLHHIRHDNFVAVLESFSFERFFYVILECMNISLVQIVASSLYSDEQELREVLGAPFNGAHYGASLSLKAGSTSI